MKDIVMRVTESEKDFIARLRDYSVFELKDLSNQLQNLLMITKLSGDYEKFRTTDELNGMLLKLVNEREETTLKKIKRKKSPAPSQKEAAGRNLRQTPVQISISQVYPNEIPSNQVSSSPAVKDGSESPAAPVKESPEMLNAALLEKLKARKFKNLFSGDLGLHSANKKSD